MNPEIIAQIKQAVDNATAKHGPMPKDKFFQLAKVAEEYGEMATVANDIEEKGNYLNMVDVIENDKLYYNETLDTIAVLVRCLIALRG